MRDGHINAIASSSIVAVLVTMERLLEAYGGREPNYYQSEIWFWGGIALMVIGGIRILYEWYEDMTEHGPEDSVGGWIVVGAFFWPFALALWFMASLVMISEPEPRISPKDQGNKDE